MDLRMLKLSKKVEYAILAVQHIAKNQGKLISAKELADDLKIDFEFLAKTLQSLKNRDLIVSKKGKGGGYELAKTPESTTISDIINAVENKERIQLVDCMEAAGISCERSKECTLRLPFLNMQNKIQNVFDSTTIAELMEFPTLGDIKMK
jgi:Rrf2 family protein